MNRAGSAFRVRVHDVWDDFPLDLPPQATVADLKRAALQLARVRRPPEDYEVKYNGARLDERSGSLADLGLPPNAPLIVLPLRRRPVR